jgi:hypothetical protein
MDFIILLPKNKKREYYSHFKLLRNYVLDTGISVET